jgi:hypothetical protein
MLPLRFPRAWFFGGLFVMAVVLAGTLSPVLPAADLWGLANDKTLHALAFMALMVWFCGVFRLPLTPLVGLGLLAFGGLIEVLQGMLPYRSAEFRDLLADGAGIAAGWLLALLGLRYWTRWIESLLPPRADP